MKWKNPLAGMAGAFGAGMSLFALAGSFACSRGAWKGLGLAGRLFAAEGPESLGLLFAVRAAQGAVFAWFGGRGRRGLWVPAALFLLGGAYGLVGVRMAWELGVSAMAGMACLFLPQFAFYGAAWLLLLVRGQYGSNIRQGRLWLMVLALSVAGVLSEFYISPFLRTLFGKIFI